MDWRHTIEDRGNDTRTVTFRVVVRGRTSLMLTPVMKSILSDELPRYGRPARRTCRSRRQAQSVMSAPVLFALATPLGVRAVYTPSGIEETAANAKVSRLVLTASALTLMDCLVCDTPGLVRDVRGVWVQS
jgi:hypothetical protein